MHQSVECQQWDSDEQHWHQITGYLLKENQCIVLISEILGLLPGVGSRVQGAGVQPWLSFQWSCYLEVYSISRTRSTRVFHTPHLPGTLQWPGWRSWWVTRKGCCRPACPRTPPHLSLQALMRLSGLRWRLFIRWWLFVGQWLFSLLAPCTPIPISVPMGKLILAKRHCRNHKEIVRNVSWWFLWMGRRPSLIRQRGGTSFSSRWQRTSEHNIRVHLVATVNTQWRLFYSPSRNDVGKDS